ncbi:MAG: hypothetical protein WDN75_21640 [Bacteroidota bacterium]
MNTRIEDQILNAVTGEVQCATRIIAELQSLGYVDVFILQDQNCVV